MGDGHRVYLEQSGNPSGQPVLYLHGGPGAGLAPFYRTLFNPDGYRIIGFDQRGSGQSTPHCELHANTTQDLLADITRIREHLGIRQWVICGGSWGSTLALLAAIDAPDSVSGLLLRGTFLARQDDLDWFLGPSGGPANLFPEHYRQLTQEISPPLSAEAVLSHYYRLLCSDDELHRVAAAKAWCLWEEQLAQLHSTVNEFDLAQQLSTTLSLATLECHYLHNRCFIPAGFILDNVDKIRNIPGTVIHGRYDMICKLAGADTLCRAWEGGELLIVPGAGHSLTDPAIAHAMRQSADALLRFLEEEHT